MTTTPFKVLFLCSGNSARSIFAEHLIRRTAPGRFESYSAGVNPVGHVNPLVLRVLHEHYKIDASDARSKSWTELGGVLFDFVITVCDQARETCPVWLGQPIMVHWSCTDPSAFTGSEEEKLQKIWQVAQQIQRRLDLFCSLPLEKMERMKLAGAVGDIGQ